MACQFHDFQNGVEFGKVRRSAPSTLLTHLPDGAGGGPALEPAPGEGGCGRCTNQHLDRKTETILCA